MVKVIGTGVDLVEVSRFRKAVKRGGQLFLNRLFTPKELAYAFSRKTTMQHLAARFAAKEAIVKALGAPKGLGLKWTDLEIDHFKNGQPHPIFKGTMSPWRKFTVHISLTHTGEYAVATALVFGR